MRYLQYFIYLIILKRNNAKDILTEIKEKYNKKLTYNYIYRKLKIIRKLLPKWENNLGGFVHKIMQISLLLIRPFFHMMNMDKFG